MWKEPLLLIFAVAVVWLVADALSSLSPRCVDPATYGGSAGFPDVCRPTLPGPLSLGIWMWLGANRDVVVALAAIVVALFAMAIYGATRNLWRVASEQLADLDLAIQASQAATEAAARSADAVVMLERSWLFIDHYRLSSDDGYRTPNSWTIVLRWRNVGRAPAIVEELILKIADVDALPPAPNYDEAGLVVCNAQAVNAGQAFVTQRIGPSASIAMKDGKPVQFVIFGRIVYRQLSGGRHATGFAMAVSPHGPTASLYRNDAYNYWN